jgi:hypothetical protein
MSIYDETLSVGHLLAEDQGCNRHHPCCTKRILPYRRIRSSEVASAMQN